MEKINYLSVINQNAVRVGVPASNKEEAFQYIAKILYEDGTLTSLEDFIKDLYYRESLGSTGIGEGVAIPHGKSRAVKKSCIAIAKLEHPISWETTDEKPVQVLILFAVKEEDKSTYFLRLMAQVARKLAQEGVCAKLIDAHTKEELLDALS